MWSSELGLWLCRDKGRFFELFGIPGPEFQAFSDKQRVCPLQPLQASGGGGASSGGACLKGRRQRSTSAKRADRIKGMHFSGSCRYQGRRRLNQSPESAQPVGSQKNTKQIRDPRPFSEVLLDESDRTTRQSAQATCPQSCGLYRISSFSELIRRPTEFF